jgi:hypothetical protein
MFFTLESAAAHQMMPSIYIYIYKRSSILRKKEDFPKLLVKLFMCYFKSNEHLQEIILLSLLLLLGIIIMLVLNVLTN